MVSSSAGSISTLLDVLGRNRAYLGRLLAVDDVQGLLRPAASAGTDGAAKREQDAEHSSGAYLLQYRCRVEFALHERAGSGVGIFALRRTSPICASQPEAGEVDAAVRPETDAFGCEQRPAVRSIRALSGPWLLTTRWQGRPSGASASARPARRAWPGMPIEPGQLPVGRDPSCGNLLRRRSRSRRRNRRESSSLVSFI